jgi:hypothetical protein
VIRIVVGPRERTALWLSRTPASLNGYMVFVNEPGRVEHLQGICQDKRYKDEALIDLTDGRDLNGGKRWHT